MRKAMVLLVARKKTGLRNCCCYMLRLVSHSKSMLLTFTLVDLHYYSSYRSWSIHLSPRRDVLLWVSSLEFPLHHLNRDSLLEYVSPMSCFQGKTSGTCVHFLLVLLWPSLRGRRRLSLLLMRTRSLCIAIDRTPSGSRSTTSRGNRGRGQQVPTNIGYQGRAPHGRLCDNLYRCGGHSGRSVLISSPTVFRDLIKRLPRRMDRHIYYRAKRWWS